jgi:hypothetical protein
MIGRILTGMFIWLLSAQLALAAITLNSCGNGSITNLTTSTTQTISSVSICSTAADRIVIVYVIYNDNQGIGGVSSVTIAGNATTAVGTSHNASKAIYQGWYWAVVPSGTTGNIDVTFPADPSGGGIGVLVLSLTGADTTTPVSSSSAVSGTSTTASTSVTVPSSGLLLAGSMNVNAGSPGLPPTWTNATANSTIDLAYVTFSGTSENNVNAANSTSTGSITVTATYANPGPFASVISLLAIQAASAATSDQSLPLTGFGN